MEFFNIENADTTSSSSSNKSEDSIRFMISSSVLGNTSSNLSYGSQGALRSTCCNLKLHLLRSGFATFRTRYLVQLQPDCFHVNGSWGSRFDVHGMCVSKWWCYRHKMAALTWPFVPFPSSPSIKLAADSHCLTGISTAQYCSPLLPLSINREHKKLDPV